MHMTFEKACKTSYHCSPNLKFNLIVGVVTDRNVDVGIFCLKIWKKRRGEERKGGERKKIRWKKDKFYIKSNNKLKIDEFFSDFFSRLPYLFFCFSFIFFQCVIEVFYYIVVEEMLIIPFRDGKIRSGFRFGLPGSEPEWQFILLDLDKNLNFKIPSPIWFRINLEKSDYPDCRFWTWIVDWRPERWGLHAAHFWLFRICRNSKK